MANDQSGLFGILKHGFKEFMDDECMTSAAALSYYTVFSLPAILMLLMLVISSVMDPSDVQGGLESQLQSLMGPNAGGEVRTILRESERPGGGVIPTIIGIVALIFGATGCHGSASGSPESRVGCRARSESGWDQELPHQAAVFSGHAPVDRISAHGVTGNQHHDFRRG